MLCLNVPFSFESDKNTRRNNLIQNDNFFTGIVKCYYIKIAGVLFYGLMDGQKVQKKRQHKGSGRLGVTSWEVCCQLTVGGNLITKM